VEEEEEQMKMKR